MVHNTPLIAAISMGFVLALIFGAIALRLRTSPLVGYLLAGVLVGPFTPGFVSDAHLSHELSEIGVILLMFGVGLHFSLKDLLSVKHIAIPDAIEAGQIIQHARALNAGLEIIARAHSDAEVDYLHEHGANRVIMGEREIARGMIAHLQQAVPA